VAFTACFREHPFGDVEGTISREAVGCNLSSDTPYVSTAGTPEAFLSNGVFGGDAGRNL
jgi:hypothetical protein